MEKRLNRLWGCIVGGAIGDALGIYNEFSNIYDSSFEKVDTYKSGGKHNVPAGTWSDDTSMSLCTIQSLIEKERFDPEDIKNKFLQWYRRGDFSCNGKCFDIGVTTRKAIQEYESNHVIFSTKDNILESGDGSLMRIYPLALFYHDKEDLFEKVIIMGSKLTHSSPLAVYACVVFSYYLKAILEGVPKDIIAKPYFKTKDVKWKKGELPQQIENIVKGGWQIGVTLNNVSPYCVDILSVVLYEFFTKNSFKEGMVSIINKGGDTDTLGAIYGNIAGCYYGLTSIPSEWIYGLRNTRDILLTAVPFIRMIVGEF